MTIIESSDDTDGDDAFFCEGDCKAWLHRKCVCLSKKLYDKLSIFDDPFYCSHFIIAKQSQEISVLRNQVDDLTKEIAGMKALELQIVDLEKNYRQLRLPPPLIVLLPLVPHQLPLLQTVSLVTSPV